MVYLTYKLHKQKQLTQIDLFQHILNNTDFPEKDLNYQEYITIKTKTISETKSNQNQEILLVQSLATLVNNPKVKELLKNGTENHYTTFRIPKTSGGFRTIEAPDEELKEVLRIIKNIFQNRCYIHPHDAAFAYTKERSAKLAIERHQYNQSKHYLHLDLKDFFTSCDAPFIHQQLQQIYPFSVLYEAKETKALIDSVVQLALYKGHLPQGTPLSPYLTNIIMIPIDYELYNLCKQRNKQHFVYTRYADDIDISSKYDFNYKDLVKEIELILARNSPLKINKQKIHYGTTAGRNWHLGLMVNQQNNITIGYKRKRELKSALLNYCNNKDSWTRKDIQCLHGQLSYFRSIEPDYHDYLIEHYSNKFNNSIDIIQELRNNIN